MKNKLVRTLGLRKLSVKMVLVYLVTLVGMMIVLNVYPYSLLEQTTMENKKAEMYSSASTFANVITYMGSVDKYAVNQAYALVNFDSSIRAIVTDGSGLALFDTDSNNGVEGKVLLFREIYAAAMDDTAYTYTFRDGGCEFVMAIPIKIAGKVEGVTYLSEFSTEEVAMLHDFRVRLMIFSAAICLALVAIILLFTRKTTRQIGEIFRVINSGNAGDFKEKAVIYSDDELGMLAGEFNQLIERMALLEEKRRSFVSDASHEIRTPLASIKLLADSILQSEQIDIGVVREFLTDINQEIDRLTRITADLLTIAKSDSEQSGTFDNVDFSKVVGRALRMVEPFARTAAVEIIKNIDPFCYVYATEDGLYQIVYNLVENGVKYNVENGILRVTLFAQGDEVILRVKDTGIGIPEEDLSRIFERFYRVDKMRSRETGGTGLGLAVVSNAVRDFGGSITVDSTPGKGSVFIARFPRTKKSTFEDI